MKQYTVNYKQDGDFSKVESELVIAQTSADAYSKFMNNHNWSVYSAWVDHYTTQKGNIHYLNNFSGKAY